jgi:hypothetical protein
MNHFALQMLSIHWSHFRCHTKVVWVRIFPHNISHKWQITFVNIIYSNISNWLGFSKHDNQLFPVEEILPMSSDASFDTFFPTRRRLIWISFILYLGVIHILSDDLLWSVSSYGEMLWSTELPTKYIFHFNDWILTFLFSEDLHWKIFFSMLHPNMWLSEVSIQI